MVWWVWFLDFVVSNLVVVLIVLILFFGFVLLNFNVLNVFRIFFWFVVGEGVKKLILLVKVLIKVFNLFLVILLFSDW